MRFWQGVGAVVVGSQAQSDSPWSITKTPTPRCKARARSLPPLTSRAKWWTRAAERAGRAGANKARRQQPGDKCDELDLPAESPALEDSATDDEEESAHSDGTPSLTAQAGDK